MLTLEKKAEHWSATRLASLLFSVLIVVAVFPDVIFKGATISHLDTINIQYPPALYYEENPPSGEVDGPLTGRPRVSFYPERRNREIYHGHYDTGGSTYQSEPMQLFMKYILFNGESPYWNPYSAAGSLGPETLVDLKFSPFSLLVAVSGASSLAFHAVTLLLYTAAIYFLMRTLTTYFRLSLLSAVAACVVYALIGYSMANLNSNTSQVYLYFPMVLYALCAFTTKPSVVRYIAVVISNLFIMSTTFLPTTLLLMISIYTVSSGYAFGVLSSTGQPRRGAWLQMIALQGSSVLASFFILAFMYFPIVETMTATDEMSNYLHRIFNPVTLFGALSFFTPKHFWESYNAMDPELWNSNSEAFVGNVVFHFGIISSIIAGHAFHRRSPPERALLITVSLLFFVGIGRIFGAPIVTDVIQLLYVVNNVGTQYWWIVVAFPFTLLVAFGFEALSRGPANKFTVAAVYTIVIASTIHIYLIYGFPAAGEGSDLLDGATSRFYISIVAVLLIVSFTIMYQIKNSVKRRNIYKSVLIFAVFIELTFYVNHLRYVREDIAIDVPSYVIFLKNNIGNYRLANIGGYGLPPEVGSAFQIQQIGSMNFNTFPSYTRFFQRNFLRDPSERWLDFPSLILKRDEPQINETILDLLAVKYVLVPRLWADHIKFFEQRNYTRVFETTGVVIFENVDHYPRMFGVPALMKHELTPDTQGFSPREVAFTEDEKLLEVALQNSIRNEMLETEDDFAQKAYVEIEQYRHTRIVARAKLEAPAVIVLMDNWHPNWKAYVNGEEKYIGLINESFRGIVLPAGEHEIEMRYSPSSLPVALAITASVIGILFALFLFRRRVDPTLQRLQPGRF